LIRSSGRLDATNIISPDLSVLVSIGLDHTDILGPTIQHITREKAGIIKPKAAVVIGPSVPRDIVRPVRARASFTCVSLFWDQSHSSRLLDA
jgi:dihydrofolate synthase/folylpolyglutamate synthase